MKKMNVTLCIFAVAIVSSMLGFTLGHGKIFCLDATPNDKRTTTLARTMALEEFLFRNQSKSIEITIVDRGKLESLLLSSWPERVAFRIQVNHMSYVVSCTSSCSCDVSLREEA